MESTKSTNYRLGTVVFDTEQYKGITPGLWKKEYGLVLKGSIRWWNFLEEEAKKHKTSKHLEQRYDENRRRIKSEGVPDKRIESREDPRNVPILPYPGRLPRINRPRNVPPTKRSKLGR